MLFCVFTGPTWAAPVAAVSQPSLLSHTYTLQPPSYNHSVTAQSPIIGVTPSIQTPVPPQHPLMTTHFQLTPQTSQQAPSMVLSMPSHPPYPSAQPTVTPSALTAQANHVVHPNPHCVMGNGHLASHPGLIHAPALPLTNGQAAAVVGAQAQLTTADTHEAPNGLQMLRTVGMGKYEFSDPGHPKGKSAQPWLMHYAQMEDLVCFRFTFFPDTEPVTSNFERFESKWICSAHNLRSEVATSQRSVGYFIIIPGALLYLITERYVGPCWNETQSSVLCIPGEFQMLTVMNMAANIQARAC